MEELFNAATDFATKMEYNSYLLDDFPISDVSDACSREKSIRQGHISTLQMWWARRPLAVSRAAIFAALCPSISEIEKRSDLQNILNEIIPGKLDIRTKLNQLISKLALWESSTDFPLLESVQEFLYKNKNRRPLVVDTFAGGGSLPIEALRIGADSYAGEINPVATVALRVAIELLPNTQEETLDKLEEIIQMVIGKINESIGHFYKNKDLSTLAFHWCRTYSCSECGYQVPLLQSKWLGKGKRNSAVKLIKDEVNKKFSFVVYHPQTKHEILDADTGTVSMKSACCSNCNSYASTKYLMEEGEAGRLIDQLYAIYGVDSDGQKRYRSIDATDENIASQCKLRDIKSRKQREVPSVYFDPNGVRHTWAYQYGVKTTSDLYNHRQGIALLEVLHEFECAKQEIYKMKICDHDKRLYTSILMLLFNRLVMYSSRHTWWQANGEFPANMFGRQAIPMVWNYVEIPLISPGAGGLESAASWLMKVVRHLASIPRTGTVHLSDASNTPFDKEKVDLVAIDPPYYDSIAYSYLSDVFYVWMRSFLGEDLTHGFLGELSPKDNEAIVDRKHSLAPNPKGDLHFRTKMRQALDEAHRILRKDGALVLMYGHKKIEAWSAILETIFESGYELVGSWPIHMERKEKFQHGKVAALSSSSLLVCVPKQKTVKKEITEFEFMDHVRQYLMEHIGRYSSLGIFGSDLATALLLPACSLLGKYDVLIENGKYLTVEKLISQLPLMISEVELEICVQELYTLVDDGDFSMLLETMVNSFPTGIKSSVGVSWFQFDGNNIVDLAKDLLSSLDKLDVEEQRKYINGVSDDDLKKVVLFLRIAALCSLDDPTSKSKAEAVLGRISLVKRK